MATGNNKRKELFEQYCYALERREEAEAAAHIAAIDLHEAESDVRRYKDLLDKNILQGDD